MAYDWKGVYCFDQSLQGGRPLAADTAGNVKRSIFAIRRLQGLSLHAGELATRNFRTFLDRIVDHPWIPGERRVPTLVKVPGYITTSYFHVRGRLLSRVQISP